MRDIAVQVAISEVLNPTLGVTEQVLAVHTLVIRDNSPAILGVDEDREVGAYYVYFEIEDEPYHFVVVIRQENKKLAPSASYIEAAVRVRLRIHSEVLNPATITEKVKIIPTESHRIGETRYQGRSAPVKFKENHWDFEPQKGIPGNLEDKLKFLLDQLEPVSSEIAALQSECEVEISISYKGYQDWMGGWHIDKAIIRRIAALGAEVDLDLYASGEHNLPP